MTLYTDFLASIIVIGTLNNNKALRNCNNINNNANVTNEEPKTKSNISTNNDISLKSKRMMYNLYNLEHKAVIRIHSKKDETNNKKSLVEQLSKNLKVEESEEDPKLSTMESSYTSMWANSDIDRINSLLNNKKNSNSISDAQQCNNVCINMPEYDAEDRNCR